MIEVDIQTSLRERRVASGIVAVASVISLLCLVDGVRVPAGVILFVTAVVAIVRAFADSAELHEIGLRDADHLYKRKDDD